MHDGNVDQQDLVVTKNNIQQFLKNQSDQIKNNARVLALKEQELKERTTQVKLNQEVALRSIDAKSHADDNHTKLETHKQSTKTIMYIFLMASVLAVVILSMFLGKDELAKDVFKYVGGAVVGFFAAKSSK